MLKCSFLIVIVWYDYSRFSILSYFAYNLLQRIDLVSFLEFEIIVHFFIFRAGAGQGKCSFSTITFFEIYVPIFIVM